MSQARAAIGFADHNGWAVAVTTVKGASVIDRRRIELLDESLPKSPHHHEGQSLPLAEAQRLVERVRGSAEKWTADALDTIAAQVSARIVTVAIRACPSLPASVAERISDYRAQNVADSVMYRQVLADAAANRGWSVSWYDKKSVLDDVEAVLAPRDAVVVLKHAGASLGPPWQKDHQVALAGGILALEG